MRKEKTNHKHNIESVGADGPACPSRPNGITLIALIITIIVMLILVAVTINVALNGGLFTTAKKAASEMQYQADYETLQAAIVTALIEGNGIIASSSLENNLPDGWTVSGSGPFTVTSPNNNTFTVSTDGTIALSENNTDNDTSNNPTDDTDNEENDNSSSVAIDASNYGDYVEYSIDLNEDGDTTNDWKIFYNDGTNIFIIAADCVKSDSEYLNLEAAEMYRYADFNTDHIYSVNWFNSSTMSSTLTTTKSSIDSTVSTLFMYSGAKYSEYTGDIATGTLLDIIAWSGFVDSEYAECAIGAPTLEMWVASYNAKGYTPLYTKKNSLPAEYGFYIGTTEDPTTQYQYITSDYVDVSGYDDNLYFPHHSEVDHCVGYWLATVHSKTSPCLVSCSNRAHYG